MSGTILHRGVINFARIFYVPYLKLRFNYKYEKVNYKKGNFIAMANHTNILDSMILGVPFRQHMYFVAGEQLFRMGFVSWLLVTFLKPIKRMKAKTEARTAIDMLRTLKEGHNIFVFPEGSSTWNGETSTIIQSTAKLVKRANVALITYKIDGGHPSMPRWSRGHRRGKIVGSLGHIYEPEELEKMSVEEIYEAIVKDLYVNSEDICKEVKFKGKNLAEYLETALFVCPKCESLASYTSKKDKFTCSVCGTDLKYTENCTLEPENQEPFPFKTVLQWDKWQRKWVEEKIDKYKEDFSLEICKDDEQILYTYEGEDKNKLLLKGSMTLYGDRLVFEDKESKEEILIYLKDMTDIAIITRTTLTFSCSDQHYEVRTPIPRSALKYLIFIINLSKMRYII